MESNHHVVRLTSAEISYLWSSYMADSMSACVLSYFLQHVDDAEIKRMVAHAFDVSRQHMGTIGDIFRSEGIAVPQGFGEQDVNLGAGRLFSDSFYLYYLENMTKGGFITYGGVLSSAHRSDIRSYYSKCLMSNLELNNEVIGMLLEKGLAVRPPMIPYPKRVEFVEKQSFLWEGLGKRALTGIETADLYTNIKSNQLGTSIAIAFSQVVQSKKVREFILRGKKIAQKHITVMADYLENQDLPVTASFDQEVTESQEPPFSDKLMIYHFGLMNYAGIGNYGLAISQSQRSDLIIDFTRLMMESQKFSEDGVNIMVENKWLEQPPLAADREDLAKS